MSLFERLSYTFDRQGQSIVDFRMRNGDFKKSVFYPILDLGPPWRDLIEKYIYRGDVSEKKPVEIWLFKTGLGQGLRPGEMVCNFTPVE